MVIPPNPLGLAIRPQAIQCARGGSRSQRRSASRRTNVREEPADAAQLDLQHKAYVSELRSLLVERLKLEDEYERLKCTLAMRGSTLLISQRNVTLDVSYWTCCTAPCG